MKSRLFFFSALFLAAILVFLFHSAAAPAAPRPRSITIVMDNNYPPYVFQNSAGELQGILIDQWKLWEQKTGIIADIHAMDWGEALQRMKAGEFDVIDTIFKTEERSSWLDFTKAYVRLESSAFFNKDISGISDAASLKGFVVAVKTGDASADVLKKHGVDSLALFNSYEAVIRAAKEHKVTVFVMDKPPALYFLHKYGIHDQYKLSPPLNSGEFHRAVKKTNRELLKIIEDGFERISQDELGIIEHTWLGSPVEDGGILRYFLIVTGSLALLVLALFIWNRVLKKGIERRTAELKNREEHISLLLDSIAEGIYGVDLQGFCTFCNPAALRLLGYERTGDLVGKKIHPLVHHTRTDGTHYHSKDCKVYCSYREGKGAHVDDEVFWRADGTSFPVEYWAQPIMRDGAPIGAVTAFTDISERRQTEDALKRSENLLQTIIDTEPDCVKMTDADGNLLMMNRAGLDMIEVDAFERVKGKCICPMITSECRQAFMDLTARVFKGESGTLAFEMIGTKGRHLWLETHAVPFRNENNEIVALLGITRDITEHRKLEAQFLQAQKMESIGTLAGGVAHDFNNILAAISGYGHLALMKMLPDDPHRTNIVQILESSDRAAHLTRDLLLFSRKQPLNRKPLDLNTGIQKLGNFLVRVIGEDIAFKITLSGGAINVLADQHQIDQVLMNLATNARDAMPKGGTFTISTEQVLLDDAFTAAYGLGMPGRYARISVSDTGEGMNEETRQRIFEPFFTTKEVGKGTGLGMSVVYGIVTQHDGVVKVYSETGHGTTFQIYLPVLERVTGEETLTAEEESPVGGVETILLAEDDKSVREMSMMILQDFGYTIIAAADGEDAVNKFRENRDRIHLLLFDLIMPKKNGKDAYDTIREMRPDIKVIFASGYDPDMVRQKAILDQNVPVVYKPVPINALLKTIRSVLDGAH